MIDGEGIILPKLKTVYVNGLSIKELTKLLNESFKEYVKYPNVEITIKNYRPVRVFVQGEVSNPGLKAYQDLFSYPVILIQKKLQILSHHISQQFSMQFKVVMELLSFQIYLK